MKVFASSLASLSIAALAIALTPAFGAETAADAAAAQAGATAPAAPAAPDAPAPGDNSTDNSASPDQSSGPPPEAPVPDPFLAEVYKTCRDGASGDRGTFQRLQDAGWNLSVDGDTQTPYYQAFNGEKDFAGVGTVDITYSLEVYPTMTEGYCSLSIDAAERKIGIADFQKMTELKGIYKETNDGVASTWEDNKPDAVTFVQADQHKKDLYFLLDVTTLMQKPAAEIPYVQPDVTDFNDNGGANGTDSTGSGTNASN